MTSSNTYFSKFSLLVVFVVIVLVNTKTINLALNSAPQTFSVDSDNVIITSTGDNVFPYQRIRIRLWLPNGGSTIGTIKYNASISMRRTVNCLESFGPSDTSCQLFVPVGTLQERTQYKFYLEAQTSEVAIEVTLLGTAPKAVSPFGSVNALITTDSGSYSFFQLNIPAYQTYPQQLDITISNVYPSSNQLQVWISRNNSDGEISFAGRNFQGMASGSVQFGNSKNPIVLSRCDVQPNTTYIISITTQFYGRSRYGPPPTPKNVSYSLSLRSRTPPKAVQLLPNSAPSLSSVTAYKGQVQIDPATTTSSTSYLNYTLYDLVVSEPSADYGLHLFASSSPNSVSVYATFSNDGPAQLPGPLSCFNRGQQLTRISSGFSTPPTRQTILLSPCFTSANSKQIGIYGSSEVAVSAVNVVLPTHQLNAPGAIDIVDYVNLTKPYSVAKLNFNYDSTNDPILYTITATPSTAGSFYYVIGQTPILPNDPSKGCAPYVGGANIIFSSNFTTQSFCLSKNPFAPTQLYYSIFATCSGCSNQFKVNAKVAAKQTPLAVLSTSITSNRVSVTSGSSSFFVLKLKANELPSSIELNAKISTFAGGNSNWNVGIDFAQELTQPNSSTDCAFSSFCNAPGDVGNSCSFNVSAQMLQLIKASFPASSKYWGLFGKVTITPSSASPPAFATVTIDATIE